MGCVMQALPCVHIECALVTGTIEADRVAVVRPVPLAIAYAGAIGAAEPAVRTIFVGTKALLVAACARGTGAAAPGDRGPCDHDPDDGGAEVAAPCGTGAEAAALCGTSNCGSVLCGSCRGVAIGPCTGTVPCTLGDAGVT